MTSNTPGSRSLPTELLKTIVPALKWGFFLLKIAASSQGLGAAVPDFGLLLPDLGSGFLDSYAASLTTQLGAKASDVAGNLAALEALLDAASSEADAAALQSVQGWVRDRENGGGVPTGSPG